jgi:hypothetical protein
MIHFLVPAAQVNHINSYLDVCGTALRKDFCVVHYEDFVTQKEFAGGTYVFSALDQLRPATAKLVLEIHQQLKDAYGVRFLNNPETTLQRFDLLSELNRQGLNEFRAVRAHGDLTSLRFPVFLRHERLHHGPLTSLLNSKRAVQQAIGRALVQGHSLRDLLIVEFCDTANEAGYYRKYGAFVVGRKVIPRSLNYGREWMLKHSQTEFTLPMVLEELDYVVQNPHEQELSKIFELAKVEYGRIDYSIKNARVQTWEINLYPTIGRGLRPPKRRLAPELDAVRDRVREYFYAAFESGWREVFLPTNGSALEIKIRSSIIDAARDDEVRTGQILSSVRTILRPVKPLIEPLSSPFLRSLCWLARVRSREHL